MAGGKNTAIAATLALFILLAPQTFGAASELSSPMPYRIAFCPDGTLYAADSVDSRIIGYNLSSGFAWSVAGDGTNGYLEGNGTLAKFRQPQGIACAPDGFLYVSDTGNARIRRVNPATGETSFIAGSGPGKNYSEGWGSFATFGNPTDITYGGGALYVADSLRVRKISLSTLQVTLLSGNGSEEFHEGYSQHASSPSGRITLPNMMRFGPDGLLYIEDSATGSYRSLNVSNNYVGAVASLPGALQYSSGNATMPNKLVQSVFGPDGLLYYSDTANSSIWKRNASGNESWLVAGGAASAYREGRGADAWFNSPTAVAFGPDGMLYVSDTGNNRIRRIDIKTNQTYLVAGSGREYTEGTGSGASFNKPACLSFGRGNDLYVSDNGNSRVRKIDTFMLQTSLVSGSGERGYAEGAPGEVRMRGLGCAAYGNDGFVYFSDVDNRLIRRVNATSLQSSPFEGDGLWPEWGGVLPIASYMSVEGLHFARDGYLYFTDSLAQRIGRINPNTTEMVLLAGERYSGSETGPAFASRFNGPMGIIASGDGTLYVADTANNRIVKFSLRSDSTSPFAGTTNAGLKDGTGTFAKFSAPVGLAFSPDGALYVADTRNGALRRIELKTAAVGSPFGNFSFNTPQKKPIANASNATIRNNTASNATATNGSSQTTPADNSTNASTQAPPSANSMNGTAQATNATNGSLQTISAANVTNNSAQANDTTIPKTPVPSASAPPDVSIPQVKPSQAQSPLVLILVVVGGILLVAAVAFFMLRKKTAPKQKPPPHPDENAQEAGQAEGQPGTETPPPAEKQAPARPSAISELEARLAEEAQKPTAPLPPPQPSGETKKDGNGAKKDGGKK